MRLNYRVLAMCIAGALQLGAGAANAASSNYGSNEPNPTPQAIIAPTSSVNPSIEITGYVATPPGPNICNSASVGSFSIKVLWTSSLASNSDSDLYELIVPGYGVTGTLAESNVGYPSPASNYAGSYGLSGGVITVPYSVAANTTITHRMTTWPNNARSGLPSFVSEMDVNCTTGAILAFRNNVPQPVGVPVGGPLASLLIAAALALTAFAIGRRRA